jgi:hypothetical protein
MHLLLKTIAECPRLLLMADKSNWTPHDLTCYMVLPPQQKMRILQDLSGGLRRNLYGISVYIVRT